MTLVIQSTVRFDWPSQYRTLDEIFDRRTIGYSTAHSELLQLEQNQAMLQSVLSDLQGLYCCPSNALLTWSLIRSVISLRPTSVRETIQLGKISPLCPCPDWDRRIYYCLENYREVLFTA